MLCFRKREVRSEEVSLSREVRERVGEGVEKGDDVTVGGDVRDRRSVFHGDKVDIPVVQDNE